MNYFITIAVICLSALTSCNIKSNFGNGIKGNKNITSTEVAIGSYNQLTNSTPADVFYEQNTSRPAYLRIEIDENLFGHVSVEVKDNMLTISEKENINPSKFRIYTNSEIIGSITGKGSGSINVNNQLVAENLSVRQLGSGDVKIKRLSCHSVDISLKGSGDIVVDSLNSTSVKSSVEGSGDIKLVGNTNESIFFVKGSGNIRAYKLSSKNATAGVKGSGDIELSATEQLNATVTGSGDIKYKGTPSISRSIKGSGDIKQKH